MRASYLSTVLLASAATSALAQSSTGKMNKDPRPTGNTDKDEGAEPSAVLSLASALIPSASINPTQSSALVHDVNVYLSTVSVPKPTATAAIEAWESAVRPADADAVQSTLDSILDKAIATAAPSAIIAQVASAVSGQSYASQATAYAGAAIAEITPLYDNLRTIVASDLGTVAPTPGASASVSTTSSQGAAPRPTGNFPAAGGAVALAVGVVGFAMM